jgi:AcrR family transcriptional regulator
MTMSATRNQLVTAALETIEEEGLGAATTRRIAERAGVNEVTLFRHFGSKAALLEAALAEEATLLAGSATVPSGDLKADLERLVRAYMKMLARRSRLLSIAYAEISHGPEFATVVQRQAAALGRIAALVAHYQQLGQLTAEPEFTAAAALIGPLVFCSLVGSTAPGLLPPIDPTDYVRAFLSGRRGAPPRVARSMKSGSATTRGRSR